jgi:hypothetical protein
LVEAYIDLAADHVQKDHPLISASRGTLAGELLWYRTISFILAIVWGMIG